MQERRYQAKICQKNGIKLIEISFRDMKNIPYILDREVLGISEFKQLELAMPVEN